MRTSPASTLFVAERATIDYCVLADNLRVPSSVS